MHSMEKLSITFGDILQEATARLINHSENGFDLERTRKDLLTAVKAYTEEVRRNELKEISRQMVDLAFRDYPSKKILQALAKYINVEIKSSNSLEDTGNIDWDKISEDRLGQK